MQIDLTDHRGIIFKLLRKAGFPTAEQDDGFQDFCVFFYSNIDYYSDTYAVSTFVELRFYNWLADRAEFYRRKKRTGSTVEIDAQNAEFLDYQQSEAEMCGEYKELTGIERKVYCQELLKDMSELTQTYLLENANEGSVRGGRRGEGIIKRTAEEQGVTNEAVAKKIRRELKALR